MSDNDNNISDDQLSQFLAFTGSADPNVAKQYLEMAGNNVEMAVSLFMDHNGSGGGGAMGGTGGSSGGVGGGGLGGMGGMGSPEVRAPDATRSMRLVGGPPSPLGGGRAGGGDDAAALMAAVAGPNAAAQMMMMGMMGGHGGAAGGIGGGIGGGGDMDDIMASTWASRDLRETVNRAASHRRGGSSNSSSAGNRRNRSSSGSGAAGGGGGGGGARNVSSGSSNNDNGGSNSRRRRRTNSSSNNNNDNNNNSDDDDEVQVVDEHGNAVGEVMMEDSDDEDSYHYNDDDSDDDHSMGGALPSSGGGAAAAAASNQRNLSTMFQPPTHLTHRAGGFLGAKNFAKDARRWLLVNIQTDDDFACHALNRDVWHDELVENLVREGFVLWQSMSTSPEGMTYVQRYKVEGYPHIAIIDPRTGSLLYRKEGWTQVNPLTAEQFVEIASDFCSRHSFDKLPMPARHGYANGGGGGYGGGGGESSLPAKRPVHELSEQEQLEAAIRASMEDASPSGDQNDDDDDEVQILEDDTKVDTDKSTDSRGGNGNNNSNGDGNEEEEEDSKLSPFEKEILSMTITDEPTSGTIARVQLRMPDGKRLVRKFDGDASIKTIYAFVAQSNDDAKGGKAFELKAKFPPVDLLSSVDESISRFGLSGETITALWK